MSSLMDKQSASHSLKSVSEGWEQSSRSEGLLEEIEEDRESSVTPESWES